jgi:hypothetical protein
MPWGGGNENRAGRALLRIATKDLAGLSVVDWAIIRRLDMTEGGAEARAERLARLRTTLEDQRAKFIGNPDTGPGARLQRCL